MASFLEKATSAFNEGKESATSSAESVSASLTDVQKTVAASTETVKTDSVSASLTDGSTQVGSWSLLHPFYMLVCTEINNMI